MKPDMYTQLARSVEQGEPLATATLARALRDASQERRELDYYRRKYSVLDKHSFLFITLMRKDKLRGYFHADIIEDERDSPFTLNHLQRYLDALLKSVDEADASVVDANADTTLTFVNEKETN